MATTNTPPHVLIIGAGMSGLTLAHQLKKYNIPFTIFEREESRDARIQGWALSLFGQALKDVEAELTEELGPVDQVSHLLPLDLPAQFAFYDITRPEMRVGVVSDETGKIIRCNRQKLRDWLLQGLDVQFNKRLMKVEESEDKVAAFFEDGTKAVGDILVGAEGTRSIVRQHLLNGKDVMAPLPLGCLVGEVPLSDEDFAQQLNLAHSGYVVMNSTLGSDDQSAIFGALNRVSPDGKTGYYYFLLLWVDRDAPLTTDKNPSWTVGATQADLKEFAKKKTTKYPDHLRVLVDRVPVEGYKSPGFQLQGVELAQGQLPNGKVLLIGDAAHSMTPFRGEAGVCAFTDAFKLSRALKKAVDTNATNEEYTALIKEFNDDMIARGKWAIEVSNPVLEDYGKYAADYKFGTFGKEAGPLPAEAIIV